MTRLFAVALPLFALLCALGVTPSLAQSSSCPWVCPDYTADIDNVETNFPATLVLTDVDRQFHYPFFLLCFYGFPPTTTYGACVYSAVTGDLEFSSDESIGGTCASLAKHEGMTHWTCPQVDKSQNPLGTSWEDDEDITTSPGLPTSYGPEYIYCFYVPPTFQGAGCFYDLYNYGALDPDSESGCQSFAYQSCSSKRAVAARMDDADKREPHHAHNGRSNAVAMLKERHAARRTSSESTKFHRESRPAFMKTRSQLGEAKHSRPKKRHHRD